MIENVAIEPAPAPDPRPASAVSHGVGVVGMAGMMAWVAVAFYYRLDGPFAAMANVLACAIPMVLWSIFVDKVHRNASTGIDWARTVPAKDMRDVSIAKLVGLWLTWAIIAFIYCVSRFYWQGNYLFAMKCFAVAAPILVVLSIPYVLWTDRKLIEPRDGAWAFGAWVLGTADPDPEMIYAHFRSWAVKGFFLAFMLAIVPGNFHEFIATDTNGIFSDPVRLSNWLITFMFVIDVAFATVGYVLTMRPLDAHIRSATPYAAGWTAALICYPPFVLMGDNGPLNYHVGTANWDHWLAGQPVLLSIVGAALVVLTAFYAWATVAFGLRFSNLTHRGILTHGPYALTRHPAYLSKNLFWWLSTMPIFTTGSTIDSIRATVLLGAVSGVYYWRAKTEEWHLGADPAYQAYSAWMERNAPVPRFFAWVLGKQPPAPLAPVPVKLRDAA